MIFLINPISRLLFGAPILVVLAWAVAVILGVIGMIKILWFD